MPPLIDGTVSFHGEPDRASLIALYQSIPYEFRVAILSAILLALAIVKVSL
jgi:hypothetical protein